MLQISHNHNKRINYSYSHYTHYSIYVVPVVDVSKLPSWVLFQEVENHLSIIHTFTDIFCAVIDNNNYYSGTHLGEVVYS